MVWIIDVEGIEVEEVMRIDEEKKIIEERIRRGIEVRIKKLIKKRREIESRR